jgi:hypothetical protein
MAINSEEVVKKTTSAETIQASDERADVLVAEWRSIRAELPTDVQDRLNAKRQGRVQTSSVMVASS